MGSDWLIRHVLKTYVIPTMIIILLVTLILTMIVLYGVSIKMYDAIEHSN